MTWVGANFRLAGLMMTPPPLHHLTVKTLFCPHNLTLGALTLPGPHPPYQRTSKCQALLVKNMKTKSYYSLTLSVTTHLFVVVVYHS